MSVSQHMGAVGELSITEDETHTIEHVGFELEYPATTGTPPAAPANRPSSNLSNCNDADGLWPVESVPEDCRGRAGTDHCGAEIRSGVMDLHSNQPNLWYRDSIRHAEDEGYTFAASGHGRSCFGLHTHLSPIPSDIRRVVDDACDNEWARVFFCSSVSERSLDPWRHYGGSAPRSPFSSARRGQTNDSSHYEFRLQEPVMPEHFDLVVDFWRRADNRGPEAAVDWARELVHERDERLTAIQQYHQLQEENDDWPTREALTDNSGPRTDTGVARWFRDLMEE